MKVRGMEMKKNRIVIVVITVIVMLAASFLIGTGFSKRTDVVLGEYAVSEDGTKLIFSAGVSSSMGYTRGFKDEGGGVKPHYLTFYGTFGGLNSDFGAKNEFELELSDTDTEIYFNRPGGGYELVLQKDAATGVWYRPESSTDEPEVMIDGEKPVFETDNISGITLYAVPNHLDGVRVPDEYMDEIAAWIGTFRIESAAG